MNCNSAVEKLVECARGRGQPEVAVLAHLGMCQACTERWESERALTEHFRSMRIAASTRRSPDASREVLMRKFAASQSWVANRWLWSVAAAAALLMSFVLVQGLDRKSRESAAPAAQGSVQDLGAQVASDTDPQYEGFIPVPYVPPLAAGELVRVVHTDLYPAALANLGVSVDPAWTTELPADLLIGQDGFPRAVRVSADYSDDRGF